MNTGNSNYSEEIIHDSLSIEIINHYDSILQFGFRKTFHLFAIIGSQVFENVLKTYLSSSVQDNGTDLAKKDLD